MGLFNMDMGMGMHMEGDIARGEHVAISTCAACHGRYGISSSDTIPNLAGQQAMYLYGALTAYRDKVRHVQVMTDVASKLSERDIADVTAYYAHLPDRKW
ncbi:cytochrome c [Candidatus Methylospira mobilis]|uniref:Cytochrome c n=2 Tax=Candidatus Methylospira mobilis TaxID=1808979 RepID=A0A5Q0BS65_9GAMM|nr:cytochrome c [Candidatus Methylospira mobilis]